MPDARPHFRTIEIIFYQHVGVSLGGLKLSPAAMVLDQQHCSAPDIKIRDHRRTRQPPRPNKGPRAFRYRLGRQELAPMSTPWKRLRCPSIVRMEFHPQFRCLTDPDRHNRPAASLSPAMGFSDFQKPRKSLRVKKRLATFSVVGFWRCSNPPCYRDTDQPLRLGHRLSPVQIIRRWAV